MDEMRGQTSCFRLLEVSFAGDVGHPRKTQVRSGNCGQQLEDGTYGNHRGLFEEWKQQVMSCSKR